MKTYKAQCKVLLTGEYTILDGAVGIGLPTHHHQTLTITEIQSQRPIIRRTATVQGQSRFDGTYDKTSHSRTQTTDKGVSDRLSKLFSFGNHKGYIHQDNLSYHITTDLSYPRERGLGSSSTLIHLYAQLIGADPFVVHQHQHPRGSGYDVACAGAAGPLLFQKSPSDPFHVTPLDRRPAFADQLYFVYSGTKQDSNTSITNYQSKKQPPPKTISRITDITHQITQTSSLSEFCSLIHEHESIIAHHLDTEPIQVSRFGDAPAGFQSKSLGGRGGDFLLIIRPGDRDELAHYLQTKNITTIFGWNDFVL